MKMKRLLAVLLSASMLLGNNSLVFAEEDFAEVMGSQSDSYNEADHLDASVREVSVIETEAETAADESESYISLETEDASLSDGPSDSDAEKDTESPETAEPLVLDVIEIEVESLEEESLEDQFSGTEAETASEAASEEEEYPDEFYLEEEIILEDINLETESFTNELPEETELETEDGIEAEEDEFAASEDLVYGDFTYRISGENAQITGYTGSASHLAIPDSIAGYAVLNIKDYAFNRCTALQTLILNDSLEYIGREAFSDCTGLQTIVFNNAIKYIGAYAFSGCSQVTELNLPEGLQTINFGAFNYTNITYIKIPASVTKMGMASGAKSVFENCENLETVEFAEGMEKIPDYSLRGNTAVKNIIFPDTVQTIGQSAFAGCTSLNEVTLPDMVQAIEAGAFTGCTSLQTLGLNDMLLDIKDYAFNRCTALQTLILNDSLEYIGREVFSNCTGLQTIVFNNAIKYIGAYAFNGCSQVTELNLPEGLKTIDFGAFNYTNITYIKIPASVTKMGSVGAALNVFENCENLETVEFAEGMEKIPDYSLRGNTAVKNIIFPDTVQTIGQSAFAGCTSLQVLDLNDMLLDIEDYAFNGCTALQTLILNDSLEYIGREAFSNCTGLQTIVFNNAIKYIGAYAFNGCSQVTELNLPEGLKTIDFGAFNYTNITYIKIPASVTKMGSVGAALNVFENCENLKTVEFADGMETVPAYSLAGNTAVKNIIFPDTLQTIGKSAFYGCTSLAAVTILEPTSSKALPVVTGVTGAEVEDEDEDVHTLEIKWALGEGEKFRIQSGAFANCAALTRIDFPSNLGNIESNAFSGCTVMNELYYPGSEEDWAKISIGSGNENITSATKHFGNEVLNQITGCQVQLCMDEDFVGAQVVRVPYESEESLSTVIEAKEKVKTYYIRIRTYRNKETEEGLVSSLGVWSDTSTLTVYNPVTANDVKKSVEAFYASMEDYFKDLKKEAKADSKNYQNNSTTSGKVLMETDLAAKDRLITFIPGIKLSNRQQEDIYTVFAGYISQVTDLEIEKISVMSNKRLESYAIKIMKTVADNLTANSDPYVQKTSSGVVAFVPMQAIGGAFTGTVKLNNRQVAVYTSGAKGTVGVMVDYLNNLKEVFADLMYQVLASYFSDLASFTGLTDFMNSEVEDWFKQLDSDLQNALANELLKAGYGNLKKILVGTQTGYKIILDVKNAVTKPELETVLKNADDIYKTIDKLDFSDNSVNKQLLGAATKELENQRSDLAKMLYAYIYGTEKGEPVSTGAKLLKKLNMNCPVDFIVYGADGNILGSVRNGAASFSPQITILVNGSTKEVWIDGTKNYTIEFIGTGTGTMNYTIQDRKGRKVVNQMDYFGVPLEEGIVYRQNISAGSFAQTSDRMPLISDTSSISSSDHFDMEGNAEYVTVTCEAAAGGRIDETSQTGEIEKGTAICVKAVPDEGYRFTGWYLGEDLKETDETYYFAAVEDVALQARFKKKVVYNHDYGSIPGKDYSDSVQIFLVKDNGEDPQSGEQLILYLDKGTEELAVTLKKYITENGEPETEAAKLIREDVYKYVLQPFSPEGYVKIEIWDENGVLIATILTKDLMPEDSCGDGNHDNDILEERAATCTTDGFRRTRCFLCEKEETVILPAAGHNWDGGRITAQPTCTAAGQKMFTCSVCGSSRTEAISPAGHKYITETVKATVTADGAVITKCSVCGETAQSSAIYYPKTITLSRTSYTYDKRVKEPEVVVTGSDGTVIPVSNYTVQYDGGRKKIGTYHVTITFKGNYSGTVTKSFTIVPKGTDISRLTARSRGFDIKLKKQSGKISGYEIQYAVNRKFTGSKKKILNKKSKITAAIKKLKAKKKYFVRVRTYKTVKGKKYFSEWSKVKKVKTK